MAGPDKLTVDRMMLLFAHHFQSNDVIFGDAGNTPFT